MEEEKIPFINPIDKDKVAENPGLLPYAHTVGGAVVKPEDKGKIKSRALTAMRQQTDRQMQMLYKQMQLLAEQAKEIQKRVEVSEKIYQADMGFEPIIGEVYYLYEREDGTNCVSMIGPNQWGKRMPFAAYLAKATLLGDHTWDVEAAQAD